MSSSPDQRNQSQIRNVYSVDSGLSFVDALAMGIWVRSGAEEKPESLSAYTILLPTRRACRALREAFLRLSQGKPLLLPRMIPLGDVDEDELILAGGAEETSGAEGLSVLPAISGLRRQLLLSQLVMAFPGTDTTIDQAAQLATELAKLLDQVHTEGLEFADLHKLVPAELSDHWQITLEFLTILSQAWPTVLAEEGCLDPADRRSRLLKAQSKNWRQSPPTGPVIAAGSTGSIPATAELLQVISALPQGLVVLPGLDRDLDSETWETLEPTHPQYGLKRLLQKLETTRTEVRIWDAPGLKATDPARQKLLSEAMRSPATTHKWATAKIPSGPALAGVARLDGTTPRDESLAIAIAMRECLELPGKRAALVTPDRNLARRVAGELKRWNIDVDDSAGMPLRETAVGTYFTLAAECLTSGLAPIPLLSLLKHPLSNLDKAPGVFRRLVRELEMAAYRGPRPAKGFAALIETLQALEQETGKALDKTKAWVAELTRLATPFADALSAPTIALSDVLQHHVAFLEGLAKTPDSDGAARLWRGEEGEALAAFIGDLAEASKGFPDIRSDRYPALLNALLGGQVVRPAYGRHPRLFIWGNMEARLQHADLIILGGLNEGTWPPDVKAGPWMSRPMQEQFGMPLPERRVGLAAHDFQQAFAAPEILLTRSLRVDGSPSLPSRWLLRLENLLTSSGGLPRADHYLDWAAALDKPEEIKPWPAPAPTPPVEARPRKLSVTRVETWIRDPYALYAERVLKLKPLDEIDTDPGAAEKGSVIHDALDEFIRLHPKDLPDDAEEKLIAIGHNHFKPHMVWPGVRAFWWPRFLRIAVWFVELEKTRRAEGYRPLATELFGELELNALGEPFHLTARADRIDAAPEKGVTIVDYKTGSPPSAKQILSGLTPQLSLEGAMSAAGAFKGIPAEIAEELTYIRLSGGKEIGKLIPINDGHREVKSQETSIPEVCANALTGLNRLIASFDKETTPYRSRPRPMFLSRFNDYDHLARVQEWSVGGEGGDE